MEFFKCRHCGNIIAYVHQSGVQVICCGEKMSKITENTVEASIEKHLPVITQHGVKVHVSVGSIPHPMIPEHYIEWIALETKQGNQRKILWPNQAPEADFYIAEDDEVIKAYAYCNLHGLWATTL